MCFDTGLVVQLPIFLICLFPPNSHPEQVNICETPLVLYLQMIWGGYVLGILGKYYELCLYGNKIDCVCMCVYFVTQQHGWGSRALHALIFWCAVKCFFKFEIQLARLSVVYTIKHRYIHFFLFFFVLVSSFFSCVCVPVLWSHRCKSLFRLHWRYGGV